MFKRKNLSIICKWKMQIRPLIEPTRLIMKIGVQRYDWHELFPKGNLCFSLVCSLSSNLHFKIYLSNINFSSCVVKSNAGAIVAVWSPIIVVSFYQSVWNLSFKCFNFTFNHLVWLELNVGGWWFLLVSNCDTGLPSKIIFKMKNKFHSSILHKFIVFLCLW